MMQWQEQVKFGDVLGDSNGVGAHALEEGYGDTVQDKVTDHDWSITFYCLSWSSWTSRNMQPM